MELISNSSRLSMRKDPNGWVNLGREQILAMVLTVWSFLTMKSWRLSIKKTKSVDTGESSMQMERFTSVTSRKALRMVRES